MACVAYGCKSHSSRKSEEELTFHRFPSDETWKSIWIKVLHRENWKPSQHSRLCSKHFTPQCYVEGKKRKVLRMDAIPTIFKNHSSYLQNESAKIVQNHSLELQRKIRDIQRSLPQASSREQCGLSPGSSKSLNELRLLDTLRKMRLKKALLKQSITSKRRLIKLRAVQQQCRRLKRKIVSLENILSELNSNNDNSNKSTKTLNDITIILI